MIELAKAPAMIRPSCRSSQYQSCVAVKLTASWAKEGGSDEQSSAD